MLSTTHSFNVWHPEKGGLPKYEETEFHFDRSVDRQEARRIIEKVEGYVIACAFRKEQKIRARRIKNKVAKVS